MNSEVMFSSKKIDWETPSDLYSILDNEFHFTLDPCSTHENHKCAKYYTIEENGLLQDWSNEVTYINPPYGADQRMWIKKAYTEYVKNGTTSVLLLPARPDTDVWFNYVSKAAQIRFIKGRLKFSGHKNAAPFPSAIVIFSHIIYPIQCVWVNYKS